MVKGLDLSHFQNVPASTGFHALYDAGIRFCFLKSTQGVGYVDPTFADRAHRLASMKNPDGSPQIYTGAYHFGDDSDPVAQVTHFLHSLKGLQNVLPALDWETNPAGGTMDRIGAEKFVARFHEVTGKIIPLYCSRTWPAEHGVKAGYAGVLKACPLWLAAYRATLPAPPAPWGKAALWQYSSTGQVGGMSGVDLDYFMGTLEEMEAFWAGHSVG